MLVCVKGLRDQPDVFKLEKNLPVQFGHCQICGGFGQHTDAPQSLVVRDQSFTTSS